MVAKPKRSIKKTVKKVIDSFKKPKPKRNPDVYKTGPGRKPKKLPKISDLLYRPKRDKYGNIIKPRPKNPKLPKDRKPPVAMPMKSRKPKKS